MSTVNNHQAPASAADRLMHEGDNVHAASILKFAAGVVVLIGIAIIASIAVLRFTAEATDPADEQAEVTDSPLGAPAAPKTRLQITPEAELQAFAREKAAVLNSYGWVDRRAGRVRIPIAQAIELVAQRGLPVFPLEQPTSESPPNLPTHSSPNAPGKEP